MDLYEMSALLAGLVIVIAGIPQILKMVRTKKSQDVSIEMFLLFLVGQLIWLSYGFHLSDVPIIVSNIGAISVSLVNIFLIIRYRSG